MIVVGGERVSSVTTRAYNDAGTAQWTADHGGTVYCVAADSNGVYTGGDSVAADSYKTTRAYSDSGALLWSASHGSGVTVYGIAVDSSGNVYTVGDRTGSVTTRKYNAAGTLQWSRDYHGTTVYAVAVDADGAVYVGGARTGSKTTKKYNAAGTLLWSVDHGTTVTCITVDSSGNVYTGGLDSAGATTRKYDSSGALLWSVGHGATVYGIAVDSSGNVYTTGAEGPSSKTTRKYNSSGTLQWSVAFGTLTRAIALGSSADSYVAGYPDLKSWDTSGGSGLTITTANNLRGVAWVNPPTVSAVPALPLPLGLGIPTQTSIVTIPPLPLGLSLGTPVGSTPPLPPDLAGLAIAQIYRAWLSAPGGADPIELPVASLQCNRRAGESTWLSLTLAAYSPALLAVLNAGMLGPIVVYTGMRLADGGESLGLFLRATLTELQWERTDRGAEITLVARVVPTASSPQTRALVGIRHQSSDAGRVSVICAVDTLLRPGDEAIAAAGATFTVGRIRYSISPMDAVMDVVEA